MMLHAKPNVSKDEYKMYKYVCSLNIVNIPKLIDYNEETRIMTTQKIPKMDIANIYSDDFNCVPSAITDMIRDTIEHLYNHNIVYPDITGYNFIYYKDKIWIIDFGHCQFKPKKLDPFVIKFIQGENSWNPEYK